MSVNHQSCSLYICSSCGGTFQLSFFFDPIVNQFSPICGNCRYLNATRSESSSGSFSPELSLKRSNSSFESLDSLAQSKSASESGRPTFDSTTSFCLSEDFSHYPDPRRELKRPKTQLPPQSGYHYVVPRSYWICNTTKLSKQKLREVYHASLVYHRG
ncbi:hypothetical protein WA171_003463, partial [Blastocystis sp. BT1]